MDRRMNSEIEGLDRKKEGWIDREKDGEIGRYRKITIGHAAQARRSSLSDKLQIISKRQLPEPLDLLLLYRQPQCFQLLCRAHELAHCRALLHFTLHITYGI